METDTTYNENMELMYLFNTTVFDHMTIKWTMVACTRANKESSEFYRVAYSTMIRICQELLFYANFEIGKSLKGVTIDWSETEVKKLRELYT